MLAQLCWLWAVMIVLGLGLIFRFLELALVPAGSSIDSAGSRIIYLMGAGLSFILFLAGVILSLLTWQSIP